jgi:ribonuclease HI
LTFEKVTSNKAELDAIKDAIEKASAKKKKTGSS